MSRNKFWKRMTKHYKTRRILLNLTIPISIFFVFSILYVNDYTQEVFFVHKAYKFPRWNRENDWNTHLLKISNLSNATEDMKNVMLNILKDLKQKVSHDIEHMS